MCQWTLGWFGCLFLGLFGLEVIRRNVFVFRLLQKGNGVVQVLTWPSSVLNAVCLVKFQLDLSEQFDRCVVLFLDLYMSNVYFSAADWLSFPGSDPSLSTLRSVRSSKPWSRRIRMHDDAC